MELFRLCRMLMHCELSSCGLGLYLFDARSIRSSVDDTIITVG